MRKKFLLLGILSVTPSIFVYADNYNIVIPKDKHNYSVDKFSDTGLTRCEYSTPLNSNVYKDVAFEQVHHNCQEKVTFSNGNTLWKDIPNYTTNEIGIVVLNSCKEIIDNDLSVGSQNYTLNINGTNTSLFCDMDTDGGGWTFLTSKSFSGSGIAPIYSIDDLNLDYSEVLYDYISGYSDFGGSAYGDNLWDWQGLDFGKNMFKFDNTWKNVSGYFVHGCNTISESDKFNISDYRVIESASTSCYDGSVNKLDSCGTKVAVKKPTGTRLTGFSDVESVLNVCHSDNRFDFSFQLFVR